MESTRSSIALDSSVFHTDFHLPWISKLDVQFHWRWAAYIAGSVTILSLNVSMGAGAVILSLSFSSSLALKAEF
jgi:hypothetical protein